MGMFGQDKVDIDDFQRGDVDSSTVLSIWETKFVLKLFETA